MTDYVPATGHTFGEWVVVEEATDKTNGYMQTVCTGCGEKYTVNLYAVLSGNGAEWMEGTESGLTFVINCGDDRVLQVFVDDVLLSADAYTVSEDGTTVTLNAAFLKTLEVGKHTLVVACGEGLAEAVFSVAQASEDSGNNSDTGDSFSAAWIAAMLVSLAGAAVLLTGRKKLLK